VTRRLVFALLTIGVAQAAVYIVQPTTSYRLLAYGGSARDVGLVAACFALLPIFLAVPLGRVSDRHGPPLMLIGCAVQTVGCLLLTLSTEPVMMAATSAVIGLGHLALALGSQDVIARESHSEQHDHHFGLLTAAVSSGQLIGPLLAGLVLGGAGTPSASATTHALVVAAGVLAIATACSIIAERDRPFGSARETSRRGSVRTIVATPGMPAGIFASVAVIAAVDVFTAYMPVVGAERGIGPRAIGLLLALRAAASIAARIGIGQAVRRAGRTRLISVGAASAAAALAAITVADDLWLLAPLCIVAGFGMGFGQPLTMTLVVQQVPEHARATALAVRLTGNRVGQVATPAAAGVIAGGAGASAAFWLISGILVASVVAIEQAVPASSAGAASAGALPLDETVGT
jgi:MFS family permease